MKSILIITFIGLLVGCSEDTKSVSFLQKQVKNLKQENVDLTFANEAYAKELTQCQEAYRLLQSKRNSSNIDDSKYEETKSIDEPQYEEVSVLEVTINGSKIRCTDSTFRECGMSLTGCSDGYEYDCLKDVKNKTVTEKRKVE